MAAESVSKGYFVCTGTFTPEATAFAQGKPLKLVTGQELLEKLTELPAEQSHALLAEITAEDHTTPTCPSCDEKMVTRKGKDGTPFWGCRNFPKCWKNFPIRKS
jgi:restriction system protein